MKLKQVSKSDLKSDFIIITIKGVDIVLNLSFCTFFISKEYKYKKQPKNKHEVAAYPLTEKELKKILENNFKGVLK